MESMTMVIGSRWGRALLISLWIAGLLCLAAMAVGLLPYHVLSVLVVVLGFCISIAVGVMSQRSGLFARPLVRVDGLPGRLALSFDDGPDPTSTPQVLDLLARFGQRATFFVIGAKVQARPDLARRIVAEGHELGNHTMDHRWHMALWPARRITAELLRASALIEETTGKRPTLFRPPAAVLSPRIAAGSVAAGLTLVGHTVRSGDGSSVISAERALRRLRRGLRPGAILLLHDGAKGTRAPTALEVLPRLWEDLVRAGLRSVPIGELLSPEEETPAGSGGGSQI